MIHRALTRSMFFAGLMLSSSVFADAEIVKCIGSDGAVTLTDARCPASTQTVAVVAASAQPSTADDAAGTGAEEDYALALGGDAAEPEAAVAVSAPTIERYNSAAVWTKRDLPGVRKYASGTLARDVTTLKAARHSLMLQDSAAQAARSQRLAGLQ
ncbi:hypothetical protein INH39_28675 [Massilia violaceinigra]|uniref:DUF4124 domain-containing protein n=1 Tax=Massilia violaceinigra TaxID=2045208 RepID=A0ABY4A5B4_9BURK|nr:hypothetical protein [Massilia violaceinigra]UOD29340.1 hypothetical protein INH39_28675 [Massilia violaceinigra]